MNKQQIIEGLKIIKSAYFSPHQMEVIDSAISLLEAKEEKCKYGFKKEWNCDEDDCPLHNSKEEKECEISEVRITGRNINVEIVKTFITTATSNSEIAHIKKNI